MEIDVDANAKVTMLWSKEKWIKGCFWYVGWKTKNYIVYNSIYARSHSQQRHTQSKVELVIQRAC